MQSGDKSYTEFLYPTSRAISATLNEYERLNESSKLAWGLGSLDDSLIPLISGLLYGIVARTSNGKTSLLTHIARNIAKQNKDEYVVYATWETLVEQFITAYISDVSGLSLRDVYIGGQLDISKAKKDLLSVLGENVIIVGRSMKTSNKQRFTLEILDKVLSEITKKRKISCLLIDYLQRIEHKSLSLDRTKQVTEHIFALKNLAQRYKIPIIFAVQAGRSIDEKNGVRWPSMSDVQWASAVEQESDVLLGVTRPIMYLEDGDIIKQKKKGDIIEYTVSQSLMGINVVKHRFGPVGTKLFYNFNPNNMEFTEIENNGISIPEKIHDDFDFGDDF